MGLRHYITGGALKTPVILSAPRPVNVIVLWFIHFYTNSRKKKWKCRFKVNVEVRKHFVMILFFNSQLWDPHLKTSNISSFRRVRDSACHPNWLELIFGLLPKRILSVHHKNKFVEFWKTPQLQKYWFFWMRCNLVCGTETKQMFLQSSHFR